MSPIDALALAIQNTAAYSGPRRPGVYASHLPKAWREALSKLTSDDLASMRVDKWEIGPFERRYVG